jgi:hypothetical protein
MLAMSIIKTKFSLSQTYVTLDHVVYVNITTKFILSQTYVTVDHVGYVNNQN